MVVVGSATVVDGAVTGAGAVVVVAIVVVGSIVLALVGHRVDDAR